jgi:hypothetical protein
MADPVDIDPKIRWEIHDDQVRERKRSARRWFLTGLVVFVVTFLLAGLFMMGGRYVGILNWPMMVGMIGMIVGAIKAIRTGRYSADVIREVEARQRRSSA